MVVLKRPSASGSVMKGTGTSQAKSNLKPAIGGARKKTRQRRNTALRFQGKKFRCSPERMADYKAAVLEALEKRPKFQRKEQR